MWTHSSGGKTLPFIQESRLVSIKLVLEIFNAPLCIICKIFSPVPPCDRTGFCKGHRQINFLTRTTACANYSFPLGKQKISLHKRVGKIWHIRFHISWVGYCPGWRPIRDWGPYPSRGFPSCMADFSTLLRRFTVFPSYFPSLWMNSSDRERFEV